MKEEGRTSFLVSLFVAIPAAVLLFGLVLFFPALTSAITGHSFVSAVWDLGFGLLWWAADVLFGKIDGPVAGMAFLVWPMLFATTIMVIAFRAFARGPRRMRVLLALLVLASLLVVVPIDYAEGSVFQTLPFWHRYQFITF